MKKQCMVAVWVVATCILSSTVWALGEETFGKGPMVYSTWVNGNMHAYYQGKTDVLNKSLLEYATTRRFGRIHEVIILPGPATTSSFDGKRKIRYDWVHHASGGMTRNEEQKSSVFDKKPTIRIFVGKGMISLAEIKIPEGIVLSQLADLRTRYLRGLESIDKDVRGYAAYFLSQVDPFRKESAIAIAKLLDDKDSWVRSMAARAIGQYGKQANFALPALRRMLNSADEKEHFRKTLQRTIKTIEGATDRTEARTKRLETAAKIIEFVDAVRSDSEK